MVMDGCGSNGKGFGLGEIGGNEEVLVVVSKGDELVKVGEVVRIEIADYGIEVCRLQGIVVCGLQSM